MKKNSGIEVRIWVGRWLEVIVGDNKRLEGLLLQRDKGESMGIKDLDEEFQEGPR